MKYYIVAWNVDAEWNWDGFNFDKASDGDCTPIECEKSEWKKAKEIFFGEFTDARMRLVEENEEGESSIIEEIYDGSGERLVYSYR